MQSETAFASWSPDLSTGRTIDAITVQNRWPGRLVSHEQVIGREMDLRWHNRGRYWRMFLGRYALKFGSVET